LKTVATVELVLSIVVVVLGAALTTLGALAHGGPLVAPGALMILVGSAWLGNVLARRNVRLLPSAPPDSDEQA